MRIAINLIPLSGIQGIPVFAQNITLALLKENKGDDFFIFGTEDAPDIFNFPGGKFIKIKVVSVTPWKLIGKIK